jgi:hypothetical protein
VRKEDPDPMMWLRLALANVNVVGRVLHLRLRSAQQGFAPSPVQHTWQLRSFVTAANQTFNARPPERAQESCAFLLTDDLHGWRSRYRNAEVCIPDAD